MTSLADRPLGGRLVVVTRSVDQNDELVAAFEAAGAAVLVVPTVAIVEPHDGGAAMRARVAELSSYDWVVLTSANAARRLARLARPPWPKVAVVGPRTAQLLTVAADLLPRRHDGAGLVEAFPFGPGRVLVPQGDRASAVVIDGLRAKGWSVDPVVAYRTIRLTVAAAVADRVAAADAVTFTSPSTIGALAGRPLPRVVVIGQSTAAAARSHGLVVSAIAEAPTPDAMVAATVAALAGGPLTSDG